MALEESLDKIPVRIIYSKNQSGKFQWEIMMDCSDAVSFGPQIRTKIRKITKLWNKLLDESKKLSKKGERKPASDYWKLGQVINNFNKKIEKEFVIINYRQAMALLGKKYSLSDSTTQIVEQFAKTFKKEEVLDKIPFNFYLEFGYKYSQLASKNLLEQEKARLLELGKKGKLQNHKKYRNELKLLVNSKDEVEA